MTTVFYKMPVSKKVLKQRDVFAIVKSAYEKFKMVYDVEPQPMFKEYYLLDVAEGLNEVQLAIVQFLIDFTDKGALITKYKEVGTERLFYSFYVKNDSFVYFVSGDLFKTVKR